MSESSKQSFQLSPRRRELLDSLLQKQGLKTSTSEGIAHGARDGDIPLSFAQERLWFLDQFMPASSVYNIPRDVPLHGPIDLNALQRSINEIVRRHEALRTTFRAQSGGRPVQAIAPELIVPLHLVDLRSVPEEVRRELVSRHAAEEFARPFDLANGPLLRVSLLRVHDEDHVLLLTMHHIVSDARSMEVFFSELWTLYQAYRSGQGSPLSELPTQYADYTLWQRKHLQGEALEAQLSYWRNHLAGAPLVLELPTDRPRPPVQTFRGALQPFTVAPALASALQSLSRREGTTMFMTILAAFNTLLFRYTGQSKLLVGTPIANRNRAELEGLIGFFVNTLVLRTDVSGDLTFRELLARVREVALGAYAHPDLPFEKLVEEMHPQRNLGHNPLFQVMCTVQSANAPQVPGAGGILPDHVPEQPGDEESLGDVPPPQIEFGTAKFDLNLSLIQTPDRLGGAVEYNTDLFNHDTITRLIGHLKTLLAAIAANPDERISEQPLITSREHRQRREWNASGMAYPEHGGIHDLVDAQAARTPDAPALAFGSEQLSYRELCDRANQLAHHLRGLGVGPEVPVGLFAERSIEMMIGLLGVMKAGGAHLPLDPAYPAKRLAYMLEHARVPVVLTQKRLAARLPAGTRPVFLDADWEEIAKRSTSSPPSGVGPDNLAYLIYTSGSTGQPKGVAMPHRTLLNLATWQIAHSSLSPGASTLQYASLSFDVSLQEIFSTWGSGGRLVLISEADRRDVGALLRRMAEADVARLFVPFIALQHIAEAITSSDLLPRTLRDVLTAGEQLQATPAIRSMFNRLDGCALRNHYGPSETHLVSEYVLEGPPESWPALPPIGRPIGNAQMHVLDPRLQPVPAGVPGELYVGGVLLARGYLHQPKATAERFIPDPFSDQPGALMYRTGDIVKYLPDGNIDFLGRADHQVKVRGYRIEPGEIETVLAQHPQVREVAVLVRADPPGEKRLVAYVTATEALSINELRGFVKERLPEYMVPATYVMLDKLPLTPSGKIDRLSLPAPDQDRAGTDTPFVAPATPVENELATIWSQVLNVRRVGIHDSFFDLGGHSLTATQVITRVRAAFGVELPLLRLFEMPTIAEFVVALLRAQLDQVGEEAADRFLAKIEALSDDDATRQAVI